MKLMLLPIQRKTRTWLLSMWNPFYCSDAHVVRSVYSALVCARDASWASSCCARSPKHWHWKKFPKHWKKIRGNSPSEKSSPGSWYLYWQSLFRSGVRSPRNSIDSVQRKVSFYHEFYTLVDPGIIQVNLHEFCCSYMSPTLYLQAACLKWYFLKNQFHKLQLQFADRVATTSRGEFAPKWAFAFASLNEGRWEGNR